MGAETVRLAPWLWVEPHSETSIWAPPGDPPWPELAVADLRPLLRLRGIYPDAVVHRDPASGFYRVEFGGNHTSADATTVAQAIASELCAEETPARLVDDLQSATSSLESAAHGARALMKGDEQR